MSDDDLIRRGDALAEIRRIFNGYPNWVTDAIAALPPAKQDDLASGKAVTVSAADLLKDVPRYNGWNDYNPSKIMYEADVLAALEPVAAPDPALRPTMTDMMVDPDTLDAFMEANPLPPDPAPTDPAAIREAALREAGAKAEDHLLNWANDLAETRDLYREALSTGKMNGRNISEALARKCVRDFNERAEAVAESAEHTRDAILALIQKGAADV